MEQLRKVSLQDFLSGHYKLFEQDYVPGYSCRYKKNGQWIRAKIDMDNGIVWDKQGNILREGVRV